MGTPAPASALTRLARLAGGHPKDVARRMLVLACELLDMDVAYLTRLDAQSTPATRTVVMAVARDGSDVRDAVGLIEPLEESWCGRVVADGAALVSDVSEHPDLADLPSTSAFGIVSHAGVVIVPTPSPAGEVLGTLCAFGRRPNPSLNARDEAVLRDLATVIAPTLAHLNDVTLPAPREAPDLIELVSSVLTAESVEGLTRPLLEALHQLTHLGSTYVTQIHDDPHEQEIRFAVNTRAGFALPEGIHVPWTDTLCKRALDEGRVCTTDVPEIWGDSEAAAALGIQVYVSVPIELDDGRFWGTLCAADSAPAEQLERHLPTMRLFSRLIAAEVQRTGQIDQSVRSAERALLLADTDPLTGCAQRRLVDPWLTHALTHTPPDHEVVVAFLDIDDFKQINDTLGHAAGDTLLVEVARRLRRDLRTGDLLARYGGDEFLVAAIAPAEGMPELARRLYDIERIATVIAGRELTVRVSVGIVSQPRGTGRETTSQELIARADQAMYARKRSRG